MWVGSVRSTLCASANEKFGTLADNNPLTETQLAQFGFLGPNPVLAKCGLANVGHDRWCSLWSHELERVCVSRQEELSADPVGRRGRLWTLERDASVWSVLAALFHRCLVDGTYQVAGKTVGV